MKRTTQRKPKIAEAKAKAEEIIQAAKAEAEEEAGKISQKSGEAVAIYGERVKSSCDMQRKKALLQAKQELIRGALKVQAQGPVSGDAGIF